MFKCHICHRTAGEARMTHCVIQMLEQKADKQTTFTCDECLEQGTEDVPDWEQTTDP